MYLTSLNPSFFFCKMVILVTPTTQGDKMNIKITGTGTCTQYMVNKCYIHVDIFSSSFHFSFPLLALFLPFPSLSFCGRQTLSKVTSMMPHHGQMCSCLCVIPSPWVSVGSIFRHPVPVSVSALPLYPIWWPHCRLSCISINSISPGGQDVVVAEWTRQQSCRDRNLNLLLASYVMLGRLLTC